jgi:hypothetical protein
MDHGRAACYSWPFSTNSSWWGWIAKAWLAQLFIDASVALCESAAEQQLGGVVSWRNRAWHFAGKVR